MPRPPRQRAHRVPRHFFCPISRTFMREPVIAPSLQETCDHESLLTLNKNTHPFPLEEELVKPDLDLRSQMSAWLHKYERRPAFAYISTSQHLESAVTTLLTQSPNDILEDSDLLDNLCQLKSALHGKIPLVNSAQGSLLLVRLVEACPVSPDNAAEWVKLSVGILAKSNNIQNENPSLFVDYCCPVLEVIDRVCVEIQDEDFEVGLVNLLYAFMKFQFEGSGHIITSHGGVIEALSSYILRPIYQGPFANSNDSFKKLFDMIMEFLFREEGLKQPKLLQAVAALVWPMHEQITNADYRYLLCSISSLLRPWPIRPDDNDLPNYNESSLELMTRAGLVSRVFQLLHYITLSEDDRSQDSLGWVERDITVSEAEEEEMILRSLQILCFLSSVTIGRLEMVRVIKRSGFEYLGAFYGAIERVVSPDTAESHVMPALSVLRNLVEKARYTEMINEAEDHNYDAFSTIDFENLGLGRTSRNFFAAFDRIETEEDYSEDDMLFWLLDEMAGGKGRSRGSRRKRLPSSENCEVPNYYSSAGEDEKISRKDIKDVKICRSGCKEDEISKLRQLNQVLLEEIQTSRKEKARLLRKIAQIESRNDNIETVKRNFQSEMDNLYGDLIEQGKMREELKDRLKESERDTEELREQLKHLMPHYRVTGHSLEQENEMLPEKVDSTRRLLEIQSKRIEEQNVEIGRLKKQVEELSRLSGELEEKNSELLKENEQEGKIIKSLQEEKLSLGSERSLLHKNLDEVSNRSEEISEKCLKGNLKMLELENQSWGLHTELAAAKSAYDEVIAQLNKIKEDMDKLSSDSYQIQEEKEALEKKLLLQLSRNKAVTEELLSVKSSFDEMKNSASKSEHQIANLKRQLLVAVKEKGNQFFDIQSQLLAMEKEKTSQLADSHDQLSILTEAKNFPVNKITELERTPLCGKEQIHGIIRKPETVLNSLKKGSESSRARTVEKKGYLADLQHLSHVAEADKGLGERSFKNYSSLTGLNKCTMISERGECESSLDFLNKDPESRDIQLQHLKPKGQALQSHVPAENGKSSVIPKNTKPNVLHGNEKPSSVKVKPKPNGIHEKTKPNGMHEKTKPNGVCKQKPLRKMPEKPKPKVWSP